MKSRKSLSVSREALNGIIDVYEANGRGAGQRIEIYAEGAELYHILDMMPPAEGPLLTELPYRRRLIVAVPWPVKRRSNKDRTAEIA
jgi:hypothetical protein